MNQTENIEEDKSSFKDIRNKIITGIFVLIPVGVTTWISIIVFVFVTNWAKTIIDTTPIPDTYKSSNAFIFMVRFLSLFILLAFLYSVGHIAKYAAGKKMISFADRLMMNVPMLKTVYSTISQIMDTIKSSKAGMFSKAVMFEYPRKGIYSIGFVTSMDVPDRISSRTGKNVISVFLPTTPNPTSGFFLLVPKEDCIFLDIGIDDAMKIVISGGALQPKNLLASTKPKTTNGENNGQSIPANNP